MSRSICGWSSLMTTTSTLGSVFAEPTAASTLVPPCTLYCSPSFSRVALSRSCDDVITSTPGFPVCPSASARIGTTRSCPLNCCCGTALATVKAAPKRTCRSGSRLASQNPVARPLRHGAGDRDGRPEARLPVRVAPRLEDRRCTAAALGEAVAVPRHLLERLDRLVRAGRVVVAERPRERRVRRLRPARDRV